MYVCVYTHFGAAPFKSQSEISDLDITYIPSVLLYTGTGDNRDI